MGKTGISLTLHECSDGLPVSRADLKKAFHILMACLGCLHLAGGPLAMLQGIAWTTMLASYSAENGIIQGASDTFGGERPCQLCKTIAAAKESEPDVPEPFPASRFPQLKMLQDMVPPRMVVLLDERGFDVVLASYLPPMEASGNDREAPPVPPPLV